MVDLPMQHHTHLARFSTTDGESKGPPMLVSADITVSQLSILLNEHILHNEEKVPYAFFLNDEEINSTLYETLEGVKKKIQASHGQTLTASQTKGQITASELSDESVLKIVFEPQAVFRVRTVTRCSSSLPGHTEAILSVNFSPDGQRIASGSGDTSIRLWDINSETPYCECRGHSNWVLCVKWSPDNKWIASGGMDNTVRIWNPKSGELVATLYGHQQFITALDWEPLHIEPQCRRLATSSKDGQVKVWDIFNRKSLFSLSSHTMSVTCLRWGGENMIYSGSQDRTIKVWSAIDGRLLYTLTGHAHWVNTISLNTDYVLRTGAFDHTGKILDDPSEAQQCALQRWRQVKGTGPERLVSGSDDSTICLWEPTTSLKPFIRLTGHTRLVNFVSWSPNGHLFVSASFDRNIRLWTRKGKHLSTFRAHVQEVYQVAWSSDSRLLVSASKDSTLKVWDIESKKPKEELPGHADEVYAVDWSPDGQSVVSGSKDRLLKIWRT